MNPPPPSTAAMNHSNDQLAPPTQRESGMGLDSLGLSFLGGPDMNQTHPHKQLRTTNCNGELRCFDEKYGDSCPRLDDSQPFISVPAKNDCSRRRVRFATASDGHHLRPRKSTIRFAAPLPEPLDHDTDTASEPDELDSIFPDIGLDPRIGFFGKERDNGEEDDHVVDGHRAYPPLLHLSPERWTMSPESVDTDLDEQVSPSLSSASSSELDELEENPILLPTQSQRPEQHPQQRYHPLDEYPSDFSNAHLYNTNHSNLNDNNHVIHETKDENNVPPTPSLSPASSVTSSSPPPSPCLDIAEITSLNEKDEDAELEPLGLGAEFARLPPPPGTPLRRTISLNDEDDEELLPLSTSKSGLTFDAYSNADELRFGTWFPPRTSLPDRKPEQPGRSTNDEHDVDLEPLGLGAEFAQLPPLPDTPLRRTISLGDEDGESPQWFPTAHSSEVPCSPSRRRSMALPDLVDGPASKKQQSHFLSLPGSDTDDDLIPMHLASKNYVPDASVVHRSSPLVGAGRSLLIWQPTTPSDSIDTFFEQGASSHKSKSRRPSYYARRGQVSPPENTTSFSDPDTEADEELAQLERAITSNPSLLIQLAPESEQAQEEVRRLMDLRRRQRVYAMAAGMGSKRRSDFDVDAEWWGANGFGRGSVIGMSKEEVQREKERWQEIGALLRLKLRLGERNVLDFGKETPKRAATLPSGIEGDPTTMTRTKTHHKRRSNSCSTISSWNSCPRITSMAQLVANMVFHRQQDAMKKHSSSSSSHFMASPASTPLSPAASLSSPTGSGSPPSTTTITSPKQIQIQMRTPRSPLRQMTLPEDLETDDVEETAPADNDLVSMDANRFDDGVLVQSASQ
ncbi:hypothetical protein D9613_003525 [Agrocybe pediades]|uniref:Uncharacterized protein n=1 Tax=Agrocybe pediades TaxID=84607 RepID=A0A8H4VNL8_9AGAR|nr:hypothetical protein D9613_003525 [Agrocybe pediades]